ncbi:MAG: hypothetical protein ACOYJD_03490 [Christensenellales bacterium]|jgi:hypothetical protein
MEIEKRCMVLLDRLTHEGVFSVSRIDYDAVNFGNIIVEIVSTFGIGIKFIKDRDDYWCEINHEGELFFIEDVFTVLGIKQMPEEKDFFDMMDKSIDYILEYMPQICNGFSKNNVKYTHKRLTEIASKRVAAIIKGTKR